jgi:lipopolysaccharide transport system ATP-binding protein
MSEFAIQVERLGKCYRLGRSAQGSPRYETLRDTLAGSVQQIFQPNGSAKGKESDFWALQDVTFDVAPGDVLGIIGRNGAGKSTLLKILSRITEPTTGKIHIKGRVASLLEVGTGFHPELTGRENTFLNGAILGMSRAEIRSKFDEIVAFAEIEDFLDTPVKRYSSGMYVRLAFAVAAHLEPEILVVDEVLAVGDAEFQKKCLGKMQDVSRGGRTVLFVSHNMGAVSRLCNHALWLDRGKLMLRAGTSDVIAKYLTSNTESGGSCEWPEGVANAGVTELKLFAVRILNESAQTSAGLDATKPFSIEICYTIYQRLPYLRVGFSLSAVDGTVIFETQDADHPQYTGKREPGKYVMRCEIPGELLMPGRYIISVNAGIPDVKNLVYIPGLLAFDVEDTYDSGSRMFQNREGVVRPRLNWKEVG